MTEHPDTRAATTPPGAISYEEHLRRVIAEPGMLCGPPIYDAPSFWQDLFPFLKDPAIRELEHRAREAWRREPEIGG